MSPVDNCQYLGAHDYNISISEQHRRDGVWLGGSSNGMSRKKVALIGLLAIGGIALLSLGLSFMGFHHFAKVTAGDGGLLAGGVVSLIMALGIKILKPNRSSVNRPVVPNGKLFEEDFRNCLPCTWYDPYSATNSSANNARRITQQGGVQQGYWQEDIGTKFTRQMDNGELAQEGRLRFNNHRPTSGSIKVYWEGTRKRKMTILPDGFLLHPSPVGRKKGGFSTGGVGVLHTQDQDGQWKEKRVWVSMATKDLRNDNDPIYRTQVKKNALPENLKRHQNLLSPFRVINYTSGNRGGLSRTLLLSEIMDGDVKAWCGSRTTNKSLEAGRIVEQSLKGLQALHEADYVHRDFKPENVLISGSGNSIRARVTDFDGLAGVGNRVTTRGTTRKYRPPRLQLGTDGTYAADIQHDIYAFGVFLGEVYSNIELTYATREGLNAVIKLAKEGSYSSLEELKESLRSVWVFSRR